MLIQSLTINIKFIHDVSNIICLIALLPILISTHIIMIFNTERDGHLLSSYYLLLVL